MIAAPPAEPGVAARRRWWWRRLVPIAAGLAALLVFEVGLRVTDDWRDQAAGQVHIHDPERGWVTRPGFSGWVEGENRVWVQTNSDGMRDREHSIAKPAGAVRIAVLGDSYMEALNVPLEKTFTTFLEQRVSGCRPASLRPSGAAARQAEVLNFGVSGYGTTQELLTYRSQVIKYRPDIVVLAVYTSNDIFNNHRELTESPGDDNPYFVLQGDSLVPDPWQPPPEDLSGLPWYQRLRVAITSRLATANLAWGGWGQLRARFAPPAPPIAEQEESPAEASGNAIYRPPATPAERDAWRVTEALFLALAREVAAQGSEFWLVTLSNAEQVNPSLEARRALAASLGVESLRYPDERIRDFGRAHGIRVITLVERLADHTEKTGRFLNGGYNERYPPGTGHWNETTNELVAGLVGDRLCAESGILTRARNESSTIPLR